VDFFCADERIVVEIDGSIHGSVEARANDAERDEYLASRGIRVLRLRNADASRQALTSLLAPFLTTPSPSMERGQGGEVS
jgi:very-short-patch-repair endonuclease